MHDSTRAVGIVLPRQDAKVPPCSRFFRGSPLPGRASRSCISMVPLHTCLQSTHTAMVAPLAPGRRLVGLTPPAGDLRTVECLLLQQCPLLSSALVPYILVPTARQGCELEHPHFPHIFHKPTHMHARRRVHIQCAPLLLLQATAATYKCVVYKSRIALYDKGHLACSLFLYLCHKSNAQSGPL